MEKWWDSVRSSGTLILMNKRFIIKLLLFLAVVGLLITPIYFLTKNIEQQNISTGFHFLSQEAGFELSESIVDYNSFMSYGRALWAGVINTLYVAIIGNTLALVLGVLLGVFSLSKNFLLSKFCYLYLNFFRNIPLLLQLFFWYGIFTDVMPAVKRATPFMGIIFSNRGINYPWFSHPGAIAVILSSIAVSFCLVYLVKQWAQKTSLRLKIAPLIFLFLLVEIAQIELILRFFPLEYPAVRGFNVSGGSSLSPELISLLLGLVLYTGAFIGEIVRAGILAVDNGQWEAAYALGMTKIQTLKKIILPQSFRVALPPMTAQFLNLTKNSSLAVAIGYPDFVSVANTTMNQTGQAVELVLLIMVLYLVTSLSVSSVANMINSKILGVAKR